MATLSTQNPTLADVAKRLDPNGKIDRIVELLNQTNGILEDATFIEGNLPTGHRTTVRTGIPLPTWRKLYGGVQPTRSTTAQVTDNCGMLEAYAEVDKALADLNGNTAAFRLSEDRAHVEGMNQEAARTVIYGNEGTDAAKFTGLAPRYNSLTAESGENIIDAGGTGSDNTSIWLVTWGENTIHAIYPKGSKAGLNQEDKGQVTIENVDGNGGRMEGYRSHYKWDIGLTVRDWRYGARIANIDVSALSDPATAKDATAALIELMIEASERIPNFGMGRAAWYVNRTVRTKLRLGILNKIANNLTWESVAGKRVMMFDDIPVRRTDALLNTEAQVV
ncbi:Bbp17 [Bordetella tumbae]|uniref:major capsid protein n=1 Tax=Bordetella tumbae TaxID=1649139 RepID=UPI0039EEC4D0